MIAEAYKPEDRSLGFRSGRRLADYVGTAKVNVREAARLRRSASR